jgi:hypothetical protein
MTLGAARTGNLETHHYIIVKYIYRPKETELGPTVGDVRHEET